MLKDNSDIYQDQRIIEDKNLDVFDYESVKRYRNRLASVRPGHVWENLDDADFHGDLTQWILVMMITTSDIGWLINVRF